MKVMDSISPTEEAKARQGAASAGGAAPPPAGVSLKSRLAAFTSHIPPGQFGRYLIVGAWNTGFGYGVYALLVSILEGHSPYGYRSSILDSDLASLMSSILSITVSYLGYKWFVFKTKGNYLREWARCVTVYTGIILLNLALLPGVVSLIGKMTGNLRTAPYLAGALMLGFNVILSFVGHKHISFRERG